MKLLWIFCLLLSPFVADCQKVFRGSVINATNNLPVENATVFVNASSISTTTNAQGEFALSMPFGRHVVVISFPGFDTHAELIDPDGIQGPVNIKLKTRSQPSSKLEADYEKGGWQKWGEYFLANFLGYVRNEEECKIKNPKVLRFRVSDQNGDVLAFADEPLIIENKTLGYTILYKLEEFHSNFKTFTVSYTGYAFFQPMKGNALQQQQWEKRRKQIYFGSIMHFMRSVYRNRLEEEGFDVRSLRKVKTLPSTTIPGYSNLAKPTDSTYKSPSGSTVTDIEDQIINPDNYRDIIGPSLPGDSIAYAIDKTTAGLYFDNFLLVNFRRTEESERYNEAGLTSQLLLINKRPLEIEADGSFYDFRDLMVLGYWTWSEKIARTLPLDYVPPKQ